MNYYIIEWRWGFGHSCQRTPMLNQTLGLCTKKELAGLALPLIVDDKACLPPSDIAAQELNIHSVSHSVHCSSSIFSQPIDIDRHQTLDRSV